jgi:hypothetical protein
MRPLDELARLWNDTRSRMPRGAWSWPLAAAAAGAVVVLIGGGTPDLIAGSNTSLASVPSAATCQEQTWPYLSNACLRHNRPAGAQAAAQGRATQGPATQGPATQGPATQGPATHVRLLNYEPAMADAAIGATPWAAKDTSAFRPPQARQKQAKQANHDTDRPRSGRKTRNAAPQQIYVVPGESAYRAYGYAPR